MADYCRGAHTVYDLKYHFVWVTEYRHPILVGELVTTTRDLLRRICEERDVLIISGHVSRVAPSSTVSSR